MNDNLYNLNAYGKVIRSLENKRVHDLHNNEEESAHDIYTQTAKDLEELHIGSKEFKEFEFYFFSGLFVVLSVIVIVLG